MVAYFKTLLQLALSPSRGWEDLSGSRADLRAVASRRMYPLFAVASLASFVQMAYNSLIPFDVALVKAAGVFASLFATYALAGVVMRMAMGRYVDGAVNQAKCAKVLIYGMSLLAVAALVCNLLPVTLGFPFLLPLAVALIIWKSSRFLCVKPDMDMQFLLFIIVTMIAPTMLIQWIIDMAAQ